MREIIVTILFISALAFTACKSTEVEVQPEPIPETIVEKIEESDAITEVSDFSYEEDEVETLEEVIEIEIPEEDKEYLRSTNDLVDETVTREEFEEDKAEILQIINELYEIMEDNNVKAWLKYIAPASITYYSDPANIRKAQKKLPDKTIQLHGIGDYFKYVFVPSRKRSRVDEIRYISKTNVKAVQVKDDESIVIYYYFVKENGKWLVSIPEL